jgi:tRNA nucleotidyltransferase/poly(A) polymerase
MNEMTPDELRKLAEEIRKAFMGEYMIEMARTFDAAADAWEKNLLDYANMVWDLHDRIEELEKDLKFWKALVTMAAPTWEKIAALAGKE